MSMSIVNNFGVPALNTKTITELKKRYTCMVEHSKLKMNVQKNGNGSSIFPSVVVFAVFHLNSDVCPCVWERERDAYQYNRSWSLFSYNRWKRANYL